MPEKDLMKFNFKNNNKFSLKKAFDNEKIFDM